MSEMGLAMMGTGSARGDDRAQAAAEAAIQNPLLDDVNLSGANGILVNITAGPDFTMREFDEVGRTIENFASEDATVVIGTVLDPDMQDEVRVTVVATGLNRAVSRQAMPTRGFEHGAARGAFADQARPQRDHRPAGLRRDGQPQRAGRAELRRQPGLRGERPAAPNPPRRTSAATAATWTSRPSCAARRTDRSTASPTPRAAPARRCGLRSAGLASAGPFRSVERCLGPGRVHRVAW